MILHEVKLRDFGVFGGETTLVLSPVTSGRFSRPITLLRGKNGVGKTTLMEAIRLALHGSWAVGSRVAQTEYDDYLRRRVHRPLEGHQPKSAEIQLKFDFFINGHRYEYHVVRGWEVTRQAVKSHLHVWENDAPLPEREAELHLREMIPIGLLDLFFFDGEKIRTLAEAGERANNLLGETIKQLLGLHLVDQLNSDLGLYLTRTDHFHELSDLTNKLGEVESELLRVEELVRQVDEKIAALEIDLRRQMQDVQIKQEQLERAGSQHAAQRDKLRRDEQHLETLIETTKGKLVELCRDVLPFISIPELLIETREQLKNEAVYERWEMTHVAMGEVREKMEASGYDPDEIAPFFAEYETSPMREEDVIHRVSAESRRKMLVWIDSALNVTPQQLTDLTNELEQHQATLKTVKEQLELVPDEKTLAPKRESIAELQRSLGSTEQQLALQKASYQEELERQTALISERNYLNDQIARSEADSTPLKLAARTRQLLQDYSGRLTAEKLRQVETKLVQRFNQLNRKRNFLEAVQINPKTFHVTLIRGGGLFPRKQLSAGEHQLFAIATLWALREVSNRPIPLLIDTPLSRLDSEHRHAILTEFFPHVAHQTIVLATDAEINDTLYDYLKPGISHFYQLEFDESTGQTEVNNESPVNDQQARILVDEVLVI